MRYRKIITIGINHHVIDNAKQHNAKQINEWLKSLNLHSNYLIYSFMGVIKDIDDENDTGHTNTGPPDGNE